MSPVVDYCFAFIFFSMGVLVWTLIFAIWFGKFDSDDGGKSETK